MCISNRLTGTFILLLSAEVLAGTYHELKPLKNRYILHRCTATVQLNRRRTNEEISHASIPDDILSQNLQQKIHLDKSVYRREDTNIVPETNDTPAKLLLTPDRENDPTSPKQDLTTTRLKDSPLRTVNIAATQENGPLIFKKKNQLPELKHDVPSSRKLSMSPSVIVIKPSI